MSVASVLTTWRRPPVTGCRSCAKLARRLYRFWVTCGAAAGIVVGYAGTMTEDLTPRIRSMPRVAGFPKTEVIIREAHRNPFDHQIRQTGATLVEVETLEQMINAINPTTMGANWRGRDPATKCGRYLRGCARQIVRGTTGLFNHASTSDVVATRTLSFPDGTLMNRISVCGADFWA